MKARRIALRALLASIAVSAIMGVLAVLSGRFGEFEMKVLATSMSLSGACVLGMACLTGWHLSGGMVMSRLGVGAAMAALVIVLPGIWTEVSDDGWWQVAASLVVVAIASAHGCLLAHARLAPRFGWARPFAVALTWLLGCLLLAVLWEVSDGNDTWQAIAVVSILASAGTLGVTVFHWMSRVESPTSASAEVRFCPACGKRLWLPAGEVRCSHCDARFLIELRPSSELPPAVAR